MPKTNMHNSNMQLSLSVVIPCYNNSQTIQRAIRSVLSQTFTDFEVIIIDDASADRVKTEEIINNSNDSRITFLKHDKNKNGAAARNTGIKAASGKFIAFLDADDEWQPNHLELAIHKLETEEYDLVYSQALVKTNLADAVMPQNGIQPQQTISDYQFVQGGVMFTPTIVVKSHLAKDILFNESLRRHQDYDFLLRCEGEGINIGFVDKPTVIIHWETNNPKSKGGTWDFSLQFAKEYQKYFSNKAYSRFILKFVVLPNFEEKKRAKGLKLLFMHTKPHHFNLLNLYFIFSYFIFGTFKHPYKWKKQ